ncbi:hypothetical protein AAW14_36055 [Streptomyces hygroscopicus]|nr:hypothetical protein [Streptomyces hygroscopicus]
MGGQLEPGQYVDGAELHGPQRSDVTYDDPGSRGVEQRPQVAAEPGHIVRRDKTGQHEDGGCLGLHDG